MIGPFPRDLEPVIAERVLSYTDPERGAVPIRVRLGAPRPRDNGGWYCPWQIAGAGDEQVLRAVGEDAFDALQLAMRMIGATLYSEVELNGVKLHWLDDSSPDLGFPNPATPGQP